MNLLVITGRLGNDAELRYTKTGKPVLEFNVAANSGWGDNQKTTWVTCHLWGERAVKLGEKKCLNKGTLLTVKGEVSARVYKNKSGEPMASLECRVDDFEFLSASSKNKPQAATDKESNVSDFANTSDDELNQPPF